MGPGGNCAFGAINAPSSGASLFLTARRRFLSDMTLARSLVRVRRIVAKFADVDEGTTFGFPAFKVKDKTFAWFPKKREVDPGTLGVRMSFLEREHWIETNPAAFYLTPTTRTIRRFSRDRSF